MGKLAIIYYHEVVEDSEGFSYQRIGITKFEEQMRYLQDNGYTSVRFDQLNGKLPQKAVIVSFDDGFRTVYENAFPIMNKYGVKGNVYLPTAYIGNNNHFMNWKMIEEMGNKENWYFAAHTHSHIDIRRLSEEGGHQEIALNNEVILSHLGYSPEAFCIPFGGFTYKAVRYVREVGKYRYMLGSFYGMANSNALEMKVLPRIGISNDDTIRSFADKMNGKLNWKGPLQIARLTLQNLQGKTVECYHY